MAALAASWGLISVLAAAVELDAAPLAFLRLALGAATVAALAVALGGWSRLRPHGRLPALALLGAVHGVHWLLFFEAVKLGSVALASITFYTAPVWLAVVAPLVLRERLSRVALLALVPGAIGVALVALTGVEGGGRFSLVAVLTGLGSAATYAVFVIGSKRLLRLRLDPISLTFWDTLFGAAVVAPALLAADRVLPGSVGDWASVLALGAVFSGIATVVYAVVLRRITAQTAGILTFLEPVSAVVLAALLLGQSMGVGAVLGGALVLLAGLVVIAFEPDDAGAASHVGSASP